MACNYQSKLRVNLNLYFSFNRLDDSELTLLFRRDLFLGSPTNRSVLYHILYLLKKEKKYC